jgi:hypothetical protein
LSGAKPLQPIVFVSHQKFAPKQQKTINKLERVGSVYRHQSISIGLTFKYSIIQFFIMTNSLSSSLRSFALTSISLLPIYGISLGLNPSLAKANISLSQERVVVKQKLIAELTATPASNLSGVYKCNDGGTYYVRQNGNNLWWYGESGDGVGWANVFKGTIRGDEIRGSWVDVPKANSKGGGIMILRASGGKLISTHRTGGFSGSEWTRK